MARAPKVADLDKMQAEMEDLARRIAAAKQKMHATYMASLEGLDLRKITPREFKKITEMALGLGGAKAIEALTKAAQAVAPEQQA